MWASSRSQCFSLHLLRMSQCILNTASHSSTAALIERRNSPISKGCITSPEIQPISKKSKVLSRKPLYRPRGEGLINSRELRARKEVLGSRLRNGMLGTSALVLSFHPRRDRLASLSHCQQLAAVNPNRYW